MHKIYWVMDMLSSISVRDFLNSNIDKNIIDISINFVSNNKSPFIILKIDNLLLPIVVGTIFANASIYDAS